VLIVNGVKFIIKKQAQGEGMPSKKHILIVDDTEDNIQVAMSVLEEDGYDFSFATNGEQAVSLVKQSPGKFDLILLDIMMPGLDGYGACKEIKSTPNTQDIPVIFLTAKSDMDSMSKGFSLGAVDFITKPFHADELLARVRTHVQLFAAKQLLQYHNIVLEYKIERVHRRLLSELEENQKEMIEVLTDLMEATSDETGKHTRRVSEMSALLAQLHPALTDEDADMLFYASPMHDVGKMTVPPEVLNKPGRYTEEEFCIMKDHTTNGHNLLRYSERRLMKAAAIIAHEHHEKWDGSGYPRQLKGAEIHIYGRIVSLADVFDALTHNRCYKDAWEIDDALAYIVDHRETQFDPELVDIMLTNLDRFKEIVSKS
jgi:putative two-component system response regulator